MKKVLEFVKEKSYYLLGATVLILVIAVAIGSCSNNGVDSYSKIESNMIEAAKSYYNQRSDLLPSNEGDSVRVNISTLVEAELLNEPFDPKNTSSKCTGHVDVIRVSDEYSYIPLLNCPGNYEQEYLTDRIKNSSLDEYGNGVYEMNGEYVYRGDDVKNYINFNEKPWRIVKVDKDGDIELVLADDENYEMTPWDESYNSEMEENIGVTTDYLHTSIRKYLANYYKNNFTDDSKAKIVSKNICVGAVYLNAQEVEESECSVIKENEKVSLLRLSDYTKSSLDESCTSYSKLECANRNYLAGDWISTWLATAVKDNTHQAYYLGRKIVYDDASMYAEVTPVIYLSGRVIVVDGDGTFDNMYKIK